MTDENKRALIFVASIIVLILFFLTREKETMQITLPSNSTNTPSSSNTDNNTSAPVSNNFDAPFYWNAGIYPGDNYVSGGNSPFNSTVNVLAQNPLLGSLSLQYFPLFGFVGMSGI